MFYILEQLVIMRKRMERRSPKPSQHLLLLLFLATCGLSTHAVKVHQTALSQLYDKLLDGNLLVRPVWKPDQPVVIYIDFHLYQIKGVNSVEQTMSVAGFIAMYWNDPFLTWNETENGVKRIQVPSDKIWTPDFAIFNSADGQFRNQDWKDANPIIHANGFVFWSPYGLFTTACKINILYFPFDKQECQIIINNWMHFSTEVFMTNASSKAKTGSHLPNSEWILLDTSIANHTFPGHGYPDPAAVVITFFLERRYQGYLYTMLIPLGLISVMGLLVFPLSVESGEKISLGVTMLLAFSVFQLVISENLPKSSKEVPFIILYVVALMAMNAASVALTVLVLHFHHKNPTPRLPKLARIFFFNFLGTITCAKSSTDEYFLERNAKEEVFRRIEESVECEDGKDSESTKLGLIGSEIGNLLYDTVKEIQKITKKMEADEEGEMMKGEWKKAGAILDRFFFLVGSVVWITGTIVFMIILSTQ